MCLCYCVLGFATHSIISSVDCDSNDDYLDDDDRYDYMGYGTDLEECANEFIDRMRDIAYVLFLLERLVMTLFTYCFEILFEIFLGACVRMIIHFDETYVTDIYIYELFAC